MSALVLGAMVAAALALAGIAWAMGLGGAPALDRASAMAEAGDRLAGFDPVDAVVSADGRAALVMGRNGYALVKAHGVELAVRRLARIAPQPSTEGVRIPSGERMFGALTLRLEAAERARVLAMGEER